MNNLTRTTNENGSVHIRYDNRASYNYQPFTSAAAATYTYDNNGNLLTRTDSLGTTTFTWNEENHLTRVTLPNSLIVNYKYDGLGAHSADHERRRK